MSPQRERLQVLSAGIFSLLLALGVARFAYTPMLPIMHAQAGLTLAEGGWLAALNYAGYLTGALLAASISDLRLKDRLYRIGMVLAVLSTFIMGMTTDFMIWAISRYLAGLSSAASMLLGTGLILNWLIRHHHRPELGIHFAGVGLGIAGCSVFVWYTGLSLDWASQWTALTALGILLMIPALAWLPQPDTSGMTTSGQVMQDNPPSSLFLRLFMASYFCAGFGFVISATFIVAIVNTLPGLEGQGAWAFLAIGVAAAPACILWDLIARRTGPLNALILAAALQIVGILLPLSGQGLLPALAGAALFGGTFIGMVSLVLTMAGRYYPSKPAKMMGKMTISYGIAQIIGPALTGWMASFLGSYTAGLYVAAVILLIGTAILMLLKRLERRELVHETLRPA